MSIRDGSTQSDALLLDAIRYGWAQVPSESANCASPTCSTVDVTSPTKVAYGDLDLTAFINASASSGVQRSNRVPTGFSSGTGGV